jgi:autotransporter-associated beta strand protein
MKFKSPVRLSGCLLVAGLSSLLVMDAHPQRQMEKLGRGVVALHSATSQAYVGWRLLATDPTDAGFNLYRSTSGGAGVKLNSQVITNTTDFLGTTGTLGTSNVVNNAALAFNRADAINDRGMISGTGKLAQIGDGTLTLSNAHTYSGATTVESGTLALIGNGSIASSASINISADALLDVSGRTGGGMTLASGQTLSGNGAVNGNLTLASGAKLAPGNSIGSMMFSNSLTLSAGSTTMLEISKAPLANDLVNVLGNLTYGGTLVVTNISGIALAAGDSFHLFNTLSPANSFNSFVLPALGTNLAWDTNGFIVSGTLAVISTAPPAIDSVATLGDGNFRLIFSGPTGQDYELRASTNLALLPVTLWDLLNSGTFGNSPVIFDDLQATNYPQRFYLLQLP